MSVANPHQKRYRLRKLRGETAYIDATPARNHLASLIGAGWSIRSIAGVSGVAASTVSRLARGEQTTASPATIQRILSVPLHRIADRTNKPDGEPFVPRTGTVRRLQALMFMGYSHRDLAAHGIDSRNLLNQQGRWVTRSRHDQVAAFYRKHSHIPGPTPRSRREAIKRGYVGPGAWDDIDHDDTPDMEWVLRRGAGTGGEWVPAEEAPYAAEDAPRIGGAA